MAPSALLAATLALSAAAAADARNAPLGPVDPPFDATRVLFSTVFSDHAVLQRAPQQAAVFGTATPGAAVTVTVAGPDKFSFTSPPAPVAQGTGDPAIDGTWKVLLPARPAGFGYSVTASCAGCSTSAPATLLDVGFGDVYLCSGQSNMECPVLTTTAHYDTFNATATGAYDHMRLFQVGWRYLGPRNASSWILPELCDGAGCSSNSEPSSPVGGFGYRTWTLPRSNVSQSDDDRGADTSHFPDRFAAVCWYFGKSLSDKMAAERADENADPVPIGLIASTVGGTSIQEWLPPSATGNDTCTEGNCGWVEQPVSELPACAKANNTDVWSCPSSACSTLWHSQIAPFVNLTIAGAIWYQGENNVLFGRGSATSGYQCQLAALISSWRAAFSAVAGTTRSDFPFGVITLAGGASEGGYLWNPYSHIPQSQWLYCQTHSFRTPICQDIVADWTAGLRAAQTGGFGFLPNAALPNVFLGQNYDQGEPCLCDQKKAFPDGCWATNVCFGAGDLSLNRTWNYEISAIHPRVKHIVGERLARALVGMQKGAPQPTPKLAGCRLAGQQLVLSFDAQLLGAEAVSLQAYPLWSPTFIPLEFRIAPANETDGSSGWVYAASLAAVNATSVSATLPPGAGPPTAVRYAWGDYACCPGMNASTFFCPPSSCPIVTSGTQEPAVPFWAAIVGGKCECDAPWDCSA